MNAPLTLKSEHIASAAIEEIWLLGQLSLREYLDYVRDRVVGGASADKRALCDEWRGANDYYRELEKSEARITDQAACRDLDPALAPLAEEVTGHAHFRRTFGTVPTRVGMVELDRLVVSQLYVNRPFVNALSARLGPAPDPQALFHFCLPLGRPNAGVEIRRTGSRRYIFSSESCDLRFQEASLLTAEQISGHTGFGSLGGVVGLMVGFGPNFLTVIHADGRLLLQNGYHRACALRELGVTHAPCVIQTVTHRDELDLVATRRVAEAPMFYFRALRPPLLKDFSDPRIGKVLQVHQVRRTIEVSFDVRESEMVE
jgi:hypothetical protein